MEQEGHKSHRTDFAPIMETSYLTAQNVRQYRAIMRLFFREYEKMHFQLYKEDVLELLGIERTRYFTGISEATKTICVILFGAESAEDIS